MAHLSLSLLGAFQVTLDGEPITDFQSNKVRALLAYLAVEADRAHRRESLVGLLWPNLPEQSARNNLRHALATLRRAIADRQATPPFLLINRGTIQFNRASDHWLDVAAFAALVQVDKADQFTILQLTKAVDLYQGSFLEGFSLKDSATFDDWLLLTQERLQRQALALLHRLAGYYEQRGEYEPACRYAWHQVELEPWREEAHQQLMRLLALNGQRSAALVQYDTCCRCLAEELGVEPGPETTALYKQIRAGGLNRIRSETQSEESARVAAVSPTLPSFLTTPLVSPTPPTPFVAREHELASLDGFLNQTLAGQGRAIFVTGGPGRGKTVLLREFARRSLDTHPDLLVAMGNCNAYSGLGDPYLPFREVLAMLTGDVEARWAAGAVTREHAQRLWTSLTSTLQALLNHGPFLINTLLPGTALLSRAAAVAPEGADWLEELRAVCRQKETDLSGPKQGALLAQYVNVLHVVATQRPLLLLLDDLQWIDTASISLLFHLGRRLAGNQILIVGAYRPEEVAVAERNTLADVVSEFKRRFGEIELDLAQMDEATSRQFVAALLDTEPNRLGDTFRETLFRRTEGHPLFTVELLRTMQGRGDLIQDAAGKWCEGTSLDWEQLPAKTEAVIETRVNRLAEKLRDILTVASVEGEVFTVQAVARVQKIPERELLHTMSQELDSRHRLVREVGGVQVEKRFLSRYQFTHALFQEYLCHSLSAGERRLLHGEVGAALEALYGDQTQEIAVPLAYHFQEAGLTEKAIAYLQLAGEQAVRSAANEEAIIHYRQGLDLFKTLPNTPKNIQGELSTQIALATTLQITKGYASSEAGKVYDRAYELCQQVGETPELFPVLHLLSTFYASRGDHKTAYKIEMQLLRLAEQTEDSLLIALAHWVSGWTMFFTGKFAQSQSHLEYMIDFYDPQQHAHLGLRYGQDPGVTSVAMMSWLLWLLGYPEQALQRNQEAMVLAQELAHPYSLVFAYAYAAILNIFCRDARKGQEVAEVCIKFSKDWGLEYWLVSAMSFRGWALVEQGQIENGIAELVQGVAGYQATGAKVTRSQQLALLAGAYGKKGQYQKGLDLVAEALENVHCTGEHYYEAEIYRLKGELLWRQSTDKREAEWNYRHAIKIARRQQAKSWELRAVMSLCRLLRCQNKQVEARTMLTEIYSWFTEGFDTPDLKEAKALLEQL